MGKAAIEDSSGDEGEASPLVKNQRQLQHQQNQSPFGKEIGTTQSLLKQMMATHPVFKLEQDSAMPMRSPSSHLKALVLADSNKKFEKAR